MCHLTFRNGHFGEQRITWHDLVENGKVTHNVRSRHVINACETLIDFQDSLLSVFVGCLGLHLFYLPISLHDSIKKYNAQVCERTLVRIEISHPHYRTTRSAVPCACCSIISHSSHAYFSFVHSVCFKYLKSVIALKQKKSFNVPLLSGVPFCFTCLSCLSYIISYMQLKVITTFSSFTDKQTKSKRNSDVIICP